jgi:hypothetical protein
VSGPSPGWRYTTGLRPALLAQPMRSLAAGCSQAGPVRSVPSTSWYVSRNAPAGASARSNGTTSEENTGQQYSSSLSSKSPTPAHTGWSAAQTRAVYRAYRNPESGQSRPRSDSGA